MSRTQVMALVIVLLAAALIAMLALRNPQPPLLPADDAHAVSAGVAGCLTCHGADGAVPRSRNHPLGPDCLRCHGRR